MNTRKMLTTGAAALVAVLAFGTDAYAFGKKRGNGCCGGGGYAAYSGCYGSGYGYGYSAGYGYGGCYGSGYGYSYAGPGYGGYASAVGPVVYPSTVAAPGSVVPAGYATYPSAYGGFSSGFAPAAVPAAVGVPYSTPYGAPISGGVLNYATVPGGRGLFRR